MGLIYKIKFKCHIEQMAITLKVFLIIIIIINIVVFNCKPYHT